MSDPSERTPARPGRGYLWLTCAALAGVGGYVLWTGHRAHVEPVLAYWPWLLVLACPLVHMFMHGGHGHGHGPSGQRDGADIPRNPDERNDGQ